MLPAINKGAGMNHCFPDVCLTPAGPAAVPVPYPNIGLHAMAAPFCPTIFLSMIPALNLGSIIPMTMGDEPGVAHPFFKQAGMFTAGSPKVFLQGLPAVTLTCPTSGNNMNAAVGAALVPSATNVFFTCAAYDGLHAMAERVAGAREVDAVIDRGVCRVRVALFSRATAAAAAHALARAAADGADMVEIDLRGNPGGDLLGFVALARDVLPRGAVVATVVDAEGDAVVHRARGDACGLPMRVVVDGGTASAAELFAACVQAHGRAAVVGERTFGKGIARAIGGVRRVTVAHGVSVDGVGVAPDAPTTAASRLSPRRARPSP